MKHETICCVSFAGVKEKQGLIDQASFIFYWLVKCHCAVRT